MLIENIELTMSHVGLSNLNEYALMVLFGDAHSHHLVRGLPINPSQIESMEGAVLYPAYFMTKLRVPLTHLLSDIKLWDTVSIGVDVRRFGETLLESNYVVGPQGKIDEDHESWHQSGFPTMQGNNLIVNEEMNGEKATRQVSNPNPEMIAEHIKIRKPPSGMAASRKIRNHGFDEFGLSPQFQNHQPITYTIKPKRDALGGHAMIFAKFVTIMDVVEYDFLSQDLFPALSDTLLGRLEVLERDIYYYGNCYAGEELSIKLYGEIELADKDDELDDDLDFIPAGYLTMAFEVYQKRTRTLIAMSRVKKVFAIPMKEQEHIRDLRRMVQQY